MSRPSPTGSRPRWAVVASRFNEQVTDALVAGALDCLRTRGIRDEDILVVRVAGAFEVAQAVASLARREGDAPHRFAGLVALAAIVRGETPHFDHLAGAVMGRLLDVATSNGLPVGCGILTCDTLEQALARSGGSRGHAGYEAAAAAFDLASTLAAPGVGGAA